MLIKKIKHWWRITKLIFHDEPVRSWRKLENGKYMCDGDCGRWRLHGVCTCGLCHYFKIDPPCRDKIQRDNVSWRRESQTENIMYDIETITRCPHDIHLNDHCQSCDEEAQKLLEMITQKYKDDKV